MKAKVEVNKLRPKWMNWEVEFEDDDMEPDCWCCGLTKEHFEAFLYWLIHCWSRKKSGRSDIQYTAYTPLRGIPDDSSHSNWRNNSTHSVRSTSSNQSNGPSPATTSAASTPSSSHGGGKQVIQDEDWGSDSSSSWSDNSDGLQMAPADMGYERGGWFSSYLSSTHGSSHGGGLGFGSAHGSAHGSLHGSNHGGSTHGGSNHGGSSHGLPSNSGHGTPSNTSHFE